MCGEVAETCAGAEALLENVLQVRTAHCDVAVMDCDMPVAMCPAGGQ